MAHDGGSQMRRLIVSPDSISGDRIHITDKDDILYLAHVLRMKEGDSLLVSDGAGKGWETRIERISRDGIEIGIISDLEIQSHDSICVTLYQGLPKGSKMEEIVRKATELGVYAVVPVGTARSIPGPGDISPAKIERWRRIAKEASKQSRRLFVPNVPDVLAFADAAAGLRDSGYDLVLVPYELEEAMTLKRALRESIASMSDRGVKPLSIAVFIGPEGGFEPGEIDMLVHEGAISVTMGDNILRTETAGPAAVTIILYELG